MAEFVDQDTCLRCTRDFGSIKSCAAGTNKDYNEGRISLGKKRDCFIAMFILLTEHYISEWGLHMVLLDIQRSIADVCSNLGLDTVLWSAILYYDDEEGSDFIMPDNVNEFGLLVLAPATANLI